MQRNILLICLLLCQLSFAARAEDGSRLWLRQEAGTQTDIRAPRHSPTLDIAVDELRKAWQGAPVELVLKRDKTLKPEGFSITEKAGRVVISSPTEKGVLYGVYRLLQRQAERLPSGTPVTENPAFDLRILNHWDNLDRSVERGYAGRSLWNWDELSAPSDSDRLRYIEYARANASIGINATVLNNVNASPQILATDYLQKVKTLADLFRPYGIRVYLSVNFASPMTLGELKTADPLDKEVVTWWKNKAKEIYRLIPDFGGFLVKANSEGQPGPNDFGRTHADGANMLADVLKPYKGIVMWRAFVYSPNDDDRAKQAYLEFVPLDGQFRDNVIIQIKNGPVDFQPREPYSPLFGATPHTDQMVEFQITQEYLGFANHLAFLAPMWKEFLEFVAPASMRAMAGVANIGTDANWCGHLFAQANWYAFGRLAWNPELSSADIAREWLTQTFGTDEALVNDLSRMMLDSHEAVVDYMMPLGLHHIFSFSGHYGPGPWQTMPGGRPDWQPPYYHRADSIGVGFNRTHTGSNAVAQYPETLHRLYDDLQTCPEEYLLWFHHVPWTHLMRSGRTLWDEMCYHYDRGVQQARRFQQVWDKQESKVDAERFAHVQAKLRIQTRDAVWWKDACLLYFHTFSKMPIPYDIERPIHSFDALKRVFLRVGNHENVPEEMLNAVR